MTCSEARRRLCLSALVLTACTVVVHPPGDEPGPEPDEASLIVNGDPQVITSFEESLSDTTEGDLILRFQVFSDPDKLAIDDELTVFVTLQINDLDSLKRRVATRVGQSPDDPITGTFDFACFCATGETPGEIFGTVTFDVISPDRLTGTAELTLSGAGESGIEIEEVELSLPFDASAKPLSLQSP